MIDNQKYSLMLPARIVEFFPEDQTATIQICAETIFSSADSISDSKLREPLEGVPVHTVGGGGWHLTMPIKAGDTCIISFSQIGYDHWLYEDKDEGGLVANLPAPHLKRQFSEDDGFVTVGFNTIPRAIAEFSDVNSEWRNDDATQIIRLKEDLSIEIDSTVSVTINAPSVVVNCETSEINASASAVVTSPIATMDCDVGTISATGTIELDAPITNISGILNISGVTNAAAVNCAAVAAASLAATGTISTGGVDLDSHTHSYTWTDPAGAGTTDTA